ncbi:uncharacterized protein LOC142547201 [Primulina tabacum]|uniref:uncharacterized protein LOC142547201 n=1 Tax=Primulina tabacum TaxID=48773 RepID=UPI003F5AA5BF
MASSSIDVLDPLYVSSSDIPGLNLISEQLIGTENYGIWSRAMQIGLRARNKLAFIDGSYQKPNQGSDKLLQWERCNAIVLSWIMNTVSKEIFGGIVYSSDAAMVWNDLRERFDKVNGSRIFALHREINCHVQGNSSISTYYSKLRQLWDEYASLVTLPICSCESSKKFIAFDQQHKLLQFLMGLNESFTHIRSHILMMDPLPTVSNAFAIMAQEESHRSLLSVPPQRLEPSAFFSTQNRRKVDIRCEHCNMLGHTKDTCFKLHGYPPGHKFYKGPWKNGNQRFDREGSDKGRVMGKANATVAGIDKAEQPNVTTNIGSFFSQEQYAAILKLLDKEQPNGEQSSLAVNMAGPLKWEDNGDW